VTAVRERPVTAEHPASAAAVAVRPKARARRLVPALAVALVALCVAAAGIGALLIPPGEVVGAIGRKVTGGHGPHDEIL
jgi:hypothetical protein